MKVGVLSSRFSHQWADPGDPGRAARAHGAMAGWPAREAAPGPSDPA